MDRTQSGRAVAKLLGGSWRETPEPIEIACTELAPAIPLLLRTGSASLAWRRLRQTELAEQAFLLRDAYRLHRLEAAWREKDLAAGVRSMQAFGARPLLVKGWAIAGCYPERGLRSYGDLDFFLRSGEVPAAKAALAGAELNCPVELRTEHRALDRPIEELYERAVTLPLGEVEVLVPCLEDHLRLLCLHMLGHGIWRPLWLCDVAVALERVPDAFDWSRLFSGRERYTEWVRVALKLAIELLGARPAGAPAEVEAKQLPGWLAPAVLKQWGQGRGASQHAPLRDSLAGRSLAAMAREAAAHWQNPIEATIDLGAAFDEKPRLPLQLGAALRRVPRLLGSKTTRY